MLDHADLRALLPHGWPILLLDRVVLHTDRSARAFKAVTAAEPCYRHLPAHATADQYAYPTPLLLESFGQAAAVLWLAGAAAAGSDRAPARQLMFVAARDCVQHAPVYPGEVVRHEVRLDAVVGDNAFASGESWTGVDRKVATWGMVAAVRRPVAAAFRCAVPDPPGSPHPPIPGPG